MLKKKIESPTTLGEIFSRLKASDSETSAKVRGIEVINNLGNGSGEVYVPCQEDLDSISVGKGAIVTLKLSRKPIGGIGFF